MVQSFSVLQARMGRAWKGRCPTHSRSSVLQWAFESLVLVTPIDCPLLSSVNDIKFSLLASSHAVIRMVDALELDKSIYRVGTSKIFCKAGVLAELEEQLFDIFSRLQARAQMWTARHQTKKVLNRAGAIWTIQRNVRVYGELRDWPSWQLYTKVRYDEPLMFWSLTEDLGLPSTCSYL